MNARLPLLIVAGLVLLLLGFGAGRWLGPRGSTEQAVSDDAASAPAKREVLYWYDPMVPDQRFDKPGKSPFMDMMLVPRYADEAASAGVKIDPALQQNLGIRTAKVEVGRLEQTLRVPGTLQWDQRAERRVSARVDGIVDRLHVATPYQRVRRGEPLATVLAPEWGAALAEYHALVGAESHQARELAQAARTRLLALGMSAADLRRKPPADGMPRVVLSAPIDGVVAEIEVREGERVMAGQPLFRINGTEQIWLLAELPQASAGGVKPGTAVEVSVAGRPGETFDGTVEAVLPDIDPTTRSQRARIVLDDPEARLAAGMVAEARITPPAGDPVPLLPSEALILTGNDARVIVVDDDAGFRPVSLRLGRRAGDQVEVLEGLKGGEWVVVSGQFLIDSEASLSGLRRRLEEAAPQEHDHGSADAADDTEVDPHAAHRPAPATEVDPHAEHRAAPPPADDPHAAHRSAPTPAPAAADPHAGHRMPAADSKPAPTTDARKSDDHTSDDATPHDNGTHDHQPQAGTP